VVAGHGYNVYYLNCLAGSAMRSPIRRIRNTSGCARPGRKWILGCRLSGSARHEFLVTNYNRGQDLLEGRNANPENHRNGQSFLIPIFVLAAGVLLLIFIR